MEDIKNLPHLDDADLKYVFKGDEAAQRRYKAARKVAEGKSQNQAAREVGISPSNVNKWVKRFEQKGDLECFKGQKRGPKGASKLTEGVILKVVRTKVENPECGGDRIYEMVRDEVYISRRSVYRILRRFKDGKYQNLLAKHGRLDQKDEIHHTSYGGSFVLAYYYDKFNLPEMFEEIGLDNRTSKLLLYYMHSKMMGFENIYNMYHVGDDGLFFVNGLEGRPHQTEVHEALRKLGNSFIEFQQKQMELLQRGYLLNLERICLDPHFKGYFGEEEDVPKNWDSVRRYLHPGYRPTYSYDLDAGCCFYALWIKEYYKGYRRLREMIKHIHEGLVGNRRIREVYLDREFYCFDELYKLRRLDGIDFTITARSSEKLKRWLERIDGRKYGYYTNSRGEKVGVALLEIPAKAWIDKYPEKLTLIGFREHKKSGKVRQYGYLSSIPPGRYRPTKLGKLAKRRWMHENYFKEVSNQQGHDDFPSNDVKQIKGHLCLEMLGHNVIQLLKKDLPKESKLKRAELKTFRIKLFQKIARIREGRSRISVDFIKYFLEQRNIPYITEKYGGRFLTMWNGKKLKFNLKD